MLPLLPLAALVELAKSAHALPSASALDSAIRKRVLPSKTAPIDAMTGFKSSIWPTSLVSRWLMGVKSACMIKRISICLQYRPMMLVADLESLCNGMDWLPWGWHWHQAFAGF